MSQGPWRQPVFLGLVALLLAGGAVPAGAQVSALWQELGGSAHGSGVSQAPAPRSAGEPSVAIGPDGRPVVAYVEQSVVDALVGRIVVKRWTGVAWETLSGPG